MQAWWLFIPVGMHEVRRRSMTRSDLISDERFAQLRDMGDDRTVRERIEVALAHFYGPAGKARVTIVPVKKRAVLRVPMLPPAPVAVPSMFGGVSAPVSAPSKPAAVVQVAEDGIDYRVIQF